MNIDWLLIKIVFTVLLIVDCSVLLAAYLTKTFSLREYRKKVRLRDLFRHSIMQNRLADTRDVPVKDRLTYFLEWHRVNEHFEISESLKEELLKLGKRWDLDKKIDALLKSHYLKKRTIGMNLLQFLGAEEKLVFLRDASLRESSIVLRLKIIQMLCDENSIEAMDYIKNSLEGANEHFKLKVLGLLEENKNLLINWADANRHLTEPNAHRILIRAAGTNLRNWHYDFLKASIVHPDKTISREASLLLMKRFGDRKTLDILIASERKDLRQEAVFHSCRDGDLPGNKETAAFFQQKETHSFAVAGLIEKIHENPQLISELFRRYQMSESPDERRGYSAVLASRIHYFIRRLKSEESGAVRELLSDVVSQGLGSPIINFLNSNKSASLETLILEAIEPLIYLNRDFLELCQNYLKDSLKIKMGLPPVDDTEGASKIQLSRMDRGYMVLLITITIFIPIGIFLIDKGMELPYMTGKERTVSFLLMYHYLFAFYSASINSISLLLMFQSWAVIKKQRTAWEAVDKKFLFTKGMLPSVTILAPAFNEEQSIVQNVYSLLSLEYPNLELIVINDGSNDRTFHNLVDNFDLTLVDHPLSDSISTAPVLGLYGNEQIPNLLVIDKKNGGKADSLNTGLNAAGGEYICSIDADSLLEPEALTKMMFQTINSDKKTVALGGNIIPVNGCVTKNGGIREIHLSNNRYSRYQTIEYLRSFVAGRLGWTRMNSLMIISGAFGAFLRKDLLEIGGYMTGTGNMRKDTVGEDMELVVRLIRHHRESHETFKIDYSHNANCWTEVPENMENLLKQRDRWHRGLIEILLYHKRMLFNKKYGAAGLVAFPYFFIFELLGPFWEFYGYCVLSFSLLFGLLNGHVILFMFSIVVLLGVLVSSTALLLAESDVLYFKGNEFVQSIATVVKENFGYRQLISMHRTFSFVAFLFRDKGWQKLKRKGFSHEQ